MKQVKTLCLLIFLTIAILCVGCGTVPSDVLQDTSDNGEQGGLSVSQWMQGFKEPAAIPAEADYYEVRRSDFVAPDIDFSCEEKVEISSFSWDARYILTSARDQDEERYFLSRQKSDLTAGKTVQILTDWQDRPHGCAICMDIVKEDLITVLFAEKAEDWQGGVLEYHLVTLSAEGKFLSAQTVTKAYQELEIESDMLGLGSWWCDPEGCQYLVTGGTRLLVIDSQGNLVLEKNSGTDMEETLEAAFHMPDGNLVFSRSIMSENRTELVWTEIPGAKEHILWKCPGVGLNQFTVTPEGILYYSSNSMLWCWNLQTGEQKRLFNFIGTGISPSTSLRGHTCYLTVGAKQELYLYTQELSKIMALTDSVIENEEDIICVALAGGNYIKNCAAAFSREHEGVNIRYEERIGWTYEDVETQWIRLSAEMAAGKVPDVMVLEYGQMALLQGLGILEPLDGYLDQEIVDAMISGIRETCYIDGELYGVAAEVIPACLLTSDLIWKKDNWTLQDIYEIIDSRELEGLVVSDRVYPDNCGPLANLLVLGGYYLRICPFYDAVKGESYFDSEEFIHLLELCKRYGKTGHMSRQKAMELLTEGKILFIDDSYNNMMLYAQNMNHYDGSIHRVCYPGQVGKVGVYGDNTYFLVVSKEAKEKETIREFLNELMGEESQLKVSFTPVNRAAIENNVWVSDWGDGKTHWMYRDGNEAYDLPNKEDGTTYVSDFIELLDSAEMPKEFYGDPVWEIVMEEVEDYWSGRKNAEDVAKTIDNKVQLYLDERN